jgi:hypothetical protein
VPKVAAPTWPNVDWTFDTPASSVAAALGAAAKARVYSEPRGRDSLGYLRLGGAVTGQDVALTAKPYATPGIPQGRSLTLHVDGTVTDSESGSRLVGRLTAPIPRYVPFLLGAWVVFLLLVSRDPLASAVLFVPIIPVWWLLGKYNQGEALRQTADVRAFLAQIVESYRVTFNDAD